MRTLLPLTASVLLLTGCAVAGPRDDGSYVAGFVIDRQAGSASAFGNALGKGLSMAGVPGGPLWGTLATSALAALGVGGTGVAVVASRRAAKHATRAANLEGQARGWDDREAAAARAPHPIGAAA